MATHDTPSPDGEDDVPEPTAQRTTSRLGKRSRDGTLATVAGGATLLWAATTVRKNAARGTLLAIAGAALIGLGRRQRRSGRGKDADESKIGVGAGEKAKDEADEQDGKQVSDDAHAQRTGDLGAGRSADESRRDAGSGEDVNPRSASDRLDDGGDAEFVEDTEPGTHRSTHLEDEHDTRLDTDDGDERTQVDISASAMADEVSEATGPHAEQAFPAREGTDPEPQSPKAPPRANEETDPSADAESEDDESGDESSEASDEAEETS